MFNLPKSANNNQHGRINEGTQVLKVVFVDYKKALGKIVATLEDVNGNRHFENFVFITKEGKNNQVAIDRFYWFAETALNDNTISANGFDEQELVGKFIQVTATITETPNPNDPNRPYINTRLNQFKPAFGFEGKATKVDPLDLL